MENFNITKIMSGLLLKKSQPENQIKNLELSIILPCRNEEQALPYCLNQIKQVLNQHNITAEIIISDSSSSIFLLPSQKGVTNATIDPLNIIAALLQFYRNRQSLPGLPAKHPLSRRIKF